VNPQVPGQETPKVSPAGTADLLQSIRAVSIWLSTRDQNFVSHDDFLVMDVPGSRVDLRNSYAEGSVFFLPFKQFMPKLVMHPFG
jgi:hypothetical protein